MPGPEATIEREGCKQAKAWGWLVEKLTSPTTNAWPDRVMARPDRGTWFVEWKRGGKGLTKQQALRHKEMREHGMNVIWFDNLDEFLAWAR